MSDSVAHTSGFRILWADDSAHVCGTASAALHGFDLRVERDADVAVELARQDRPALTFAAAPLYTRDGTPLLRALRACASAPASTFVLVCQRGHEASLSEGLLSAADDLLLTPFSASELKARVQAHVRRWRARGEACADAAFLSSVGHELRTPLTSILLWASSLRDAARGEPELERGLRCIAASAEGQSRRIDDLLDLSRLATGRLVLYPRRTCLVTLVRGARDELWPLAAAKRVALELQLTEPLGDAEIDAARLHQVISNLLSNAIKFTSAGGAVTLRAHRSETALELEVSDTGAGIAPELMPHIFERFQQGSVEQTRRQQGLGIGLALSHQLVSLHGGSIEAHSAGPGQGASFHVHLPLPDPARAVRRDAQAGRAAATRALRDRTILLVEDHEETREAMQFVLERAGGRVLTADSGGTGLALLAADVEAGGARNGTAVDVIVCDLGLPDMSGYEFIERVGQAYRRARRSQPPSCAVSAHARDVDRRRAIEAGFDLHVAKPVTALGLVEAVDDLCQVARTHVAEGSDPMFTA